MMEMASQLDPQSLEAFQRACASGDLPRVEHGLAAGIAVNTVFANGMGGLHVAAHNNQLLVCRLLVQRGADMEQPDAQGDTPLQCTLTSGLKAAAELIELGAAVDFQGKLAADLMHEACRAGERDLCAVLLRGGTPGLVQDPFGVMAFHVAMAKGHADLGDLFLASGVDLNARAETGWTPLHAAAANGHGEAVAWLLAQGADLEARTEDGANAIRLAASSHGKEAIRHLLVKEADFLAQDRFGNSALGVLAYRLEMASCAACLALAPDFEASLALVKQEVDNSLLKGKRSQKVVYPASRVEAALCSSHPDIVMRSLNIAAEQGATPQAMAADLDAALQAAQQAGHPLNSLAPDDLQRLEQMARSWIAGLAARAALQDAVHAAAALPRAFLS